MKYFLKLHFWKLAIGLGLMVSIVVLWASFTGSGSETPQPTAKIAKGSPQPTPTPIESQTTSVPGPRPSPTDTPPPPTATPTPIPVYHVVEAGEVPLTIAEQYGIAVATLLAVNQITDPTRLQIGEQLLIPVTVTPTPAATPTPKESPTSTSTPVYHTVQAGDTLGAIAAEYDTSVEAIALANELTDPQRLRVGQELLIPQGGVNFGTPTKVHVVEEGDTVSRLAFMYGSTIEDIAAANPGLNPDVLRVGQKVIVPITSPPLNPQADPLLPQNTTPDESLPNLPTVRQQVIEGVNDQRQANDLPPLAADEELNRLALVHAQDMVKRGYFAHVTPRGVDLETRFAQQGIEADWMGENIQRNTKPKDETAAEAVRWFMNSAPHRANILHRRFNSIGVGVVEEPPGWFTFVLVFAER